MKRPDTQLVAIWTVVLILVVMGLGGLTSGTTVDIERRGETCYQQTTNTAFGGALRLGTNEVVIACEEDR